MKSEDVQVYSVCILQFSCFTKNPKNNRMQSKHKQTKCEHMQTKLLQITTFSIGITILNYKLI